MPKRRFGSSICSENYDKIFVTRKFIGNWQPHNLVFYPQIKNTNNRKAVFSETK